VSLNRWVFKWRLTVRMFSHSRMSAGRERVPGGHPSSAGRAQDSEISPVRDRRSTTVPRNHVYCSPVQFWRRDMYAEMQRTNSSLAAAALACRRAIQPRNERYKPATHAVDADCSYKAIRKTIWKFRTQETDCLATDTGSNSAAVSRYDI